MSFLNSEVASPARPVRPGWTLALVAAAAFLTSLDVMVVVTALPTIRIQLDASLSDLEWTVNAYNLAFACLMLTGSALGDRFGRLRIYVLGLSLFTLASALAALAATVDVLVVARMLQGIGAGVAIPVSLTLLSDAFPPQKRGMAMGVWGSVSGLAIAAGPVAGGLITQGLFWQWIFWLNVPFGLAAAVLSALLLQESRGPRPKLDLIGLFLASLGVLGLVWAAVRAPSVGWSGVEVIVTLSVGVLLLVAFVARERSARYPMLPLRYFRIRAFSVANVATFFEHFALIGSLFMLAQLFQIGMGNGPLGTGLRMLAWTAMPLVVGTVAGRLADRFGNRPFMVIGLLLQGIGLLWISAEVAPGAAYGGMVAPLMLGGIGIAMCLPTTINMVLLSVPQDDVGVASGANSSIREIGGVFGVVFLSGTFAAYGSYASPASSMDGFRAALALGGAASLIGMVAAVFAPGRRRIAEEATARQGPALPQTEIS
jgi:EmrB/QacA subfamily drug resistance transporter